MLGVDESLAGSPRELELMDSPSAINTTGMTSTQVKCQVKFI